MRIEAATESAKRQKAQRAQQHFARKRLALEAQVEALQAELAEIEQEAKQASAQEKERDDELLLDRKRMAESPGSGKEAADD
jgi:circadian clock protein KaiC